MIDTTLLQTETPATVGGLRVKEAVELIDNLMFRDSVWHGLSDEGKRWLVVSVYTNQPLHIFRNGKRIAEMIKKVLDEGGTLS